MFLLHRHEIKLMFPQITVVTLGLNLLMTQLLSQHVAIKKITFQTDLEQRRKYLKCTNICHSVTRKHETVAFSDSKPKGWDEIKGLCVCMQAHVSLWRLVCKAL